LAGTWKFKPLLFDPLLPVNTTAGGAYNYNALLMGDVTGDWLPGGPLRPAVIPDRRNAVRASVPNVEAQSGTTVTVPLTINNLRGESVGSYQFDIEYDPAVIEPADVAAEIAGTIGETLNVVSNSPEPGLLKVAVYGAFPVGGDGVFANLKFRTIGAVGSRTALTIREFQFNEGRTYVATESGQVTVTPSQSSTIRGRVLTTTGQGVRNSRVILTSTTGDRFAVLSATFGNFEFGGLTVGETYTVTVESKRYTFTPRTVSVSNNVTDVDMIADR
jgi:hypothetical protein